jgi:methylmalonyl-CoA mutase N-terminal domain/subunit
VAETGKQDSIYELDAGPSVREAYGPEDVLSDPACPGTFPFTRGIHADGVRSHPTLIKMYSGLGTPEESGTRFRKLAGWGVDILQIASDLPSQIGYDPDHIMAAGEVGRAGTSLASLRDLEVAFDGLPLSRFRRVGIVMNCLGPVALALFAVLGEKQGIGRDDFVVDLQNDPLKEYVARGTQFLPVEAAVRLACDVVAWTTEHAPHWYPLDVCVNHLNMAGAGSTRGTAYALANAECYIEELLGRGLDIDAFAPSLQLFLDEREDFFVALANIRATRKIWAELLRERFGARDPRSLALRVIAYGHGRESRTEPLNNIARIALGALAYYLAGVQSLYTASYDEVLQAPSDESVKIAIRTQQILANELGFALTADPLGGSYYLESLTAELERAIREELDEIERDGGAIAGIASGRIRTALTDGAVRRQSRFEQGFRPWVGVDRFLDGDSDDAWMVRPVKRMTDEDEERRRREVAELRRTREQRRVADALRQLEAGTARGDNSVPAVLEAVRAYATVGEIANVFRTVFGEWEPERTF